MNYNARTQPLFCLLNLLFRDVAIAVVVVVLLNSNVSGNRLEPEKRENSKRNQARTPKFLESFQPLGSPTENYRINTKISRQLICCFALTVIFLDQVYQDCTWLKHS